MEQIIMSKIAKKILKMCLSAKEGEELCIVTELKKISIAKAIATQAYAIGVEPVILLMIPRENDGSEPPKVISEAMKKSDMFLAIVEKSITHTWAVKNAIENGSRGLVLTQFTESMMIKGGMEANFEKIKPNCIRVSKILENSNNIRVTTKLGTDLSFSARGRRGNALYCMVDRKEFSTAPTIEANVSPLEGTANGKIVVDASIPYLGIGLLNKPIIIEVKNGKIISIEGNEQSEILKNDLRDKNDENAYNIAELGIGMNPCCKFVGLMLEDEGVYGSVHIGIGTNVTLGGNIKTKCHYDLIMKNPTVVADGFKVVSDGKIEEEKEYEDKY